MAKPDAPEYGGTSSDGGHLARHDQPGVEIYLAATDGCGWSEADYACWLASLLTNQLLTEESAR